MTISKKIRLFSVIHNKCPRCHEGDFFVSNQAFNPMSFARMHSNCSYCGLSFEQEPGYYFGAMYISYAINVAVMVAVWITSILMFGDSINIWWIVLASIIIGLGLTPLTFRLSRLGWINFFIKYKPGILEGKK